MISLFDLMAMHTVGMNTLTEHLVNMGYNDGIADASASTK